jgi:proline dehydrogenase
MFSAASKAVFHLMAQNRVLQTLASRYGMASDRSFARRFIAGESVDEAIAAAGRVEARGFGQTLDYLGESVSTLDAAAEATGEYLDIIDRVVATGIGRNLSLKLTQLGLAVDRAATIDNLRRILEPASAHGFFVRIDMESSAYTQVTLEIFETLWDLGHRNVGVVIQSMLHRSDDDIARLIALGARVRLVKGAYKEGADVAYQRKAEVDAAYVRMMEELLSQGRYPALATHDPAIIDLACRHVERQGLARDRFEFQMLYGVRRDLQASLLADGYGVRVYIPFGQQWFAYFMRRLGERPANIGFVLRSLRRER